MFRSGFYLIRSCAWLPALLLCLLSPCAAQIQTQQPGELAGRVQDPAGAVVPGATVTLEASGGRWRRTTVSDQSGAYRLAELPPGSYTLSVTAASFREARAEVQVGPAQSRVFNVTLEIAAVAGRVNVTADAAEAVRAEVADNYNRNKAVTTLEGATVQQYSPVANYDALRLLPGVMSAAWGAKDRFSVPSHIRGNGAWGAVEQVDDYPTINITPVSAEDGGYTASFSSTIPSLALQDLTLATGGLGVSYGQATGGIVRSQIKRGSARGPHSTLRLEGSGIGEGTVMGETGGVFRNFDVYVAGQTIYGSYGDAFETYARPIQKTRLASGLAKVGYKVNGKSRLEGLFIGGDESHDFFQLAFDNTLKQNVRRDFHTEKQNYFVAARYDYRPSDNTVFGFGATHNRFHENRIEDAYNRTPLGLSRRNRPQEATRLFANANWRAALSDNLSYTANGGAEITWDRFRDITTTPISFSFREQAVYYRNSLVVKRALAINAGIRLAALDNGFGRQYPALYDVGVAYDLPTRTRLKASYSTGYKLNKAFYLWWGGGQFIRRQPAEGLRPSRTNTAEVGVEQNLTINGRTGLVRVSYFQTNERDLFNFGNSGGGIPFYDDQRTRSLEVWTEWKLARLRPFASFTSLRGVRTRSTNPAANNVDLRFAPLPNYAASFGSHFDVSRRWSGALLGYFDDGGVNEQVVADSVVVSRYGRFIKVNGSVSFKWSENLGLTLRAENLFNRRDLGYSRSVLNADGTSQRVAGTQRDPGLVVAGGLQIRF